MRLFHVTHTKRFTGSVAVLYNSEGVLQRVDFGDTNLAAKGRETFLVSLAVNVEELGKGWGSDTVVHEGTFEISFEDFIREYPYKRNTHKARERWPKLTTAEQFQAYEAAKEYRRYYNRNSAWYTPRIADTWLKEKEYLNDWKTL